MGIFSSKTEIYVDSVAYNMAGDYGERINYLRSTVSRYVLDASVKDSLAQAVFDTQLNGPSISTQRSFYRWAKNHYALGNITGTVHNYRKVTAILAEDILRGFYPSGAIEITSAFIDSADIIHWGEKYIREEASNTNNIASWSANYIDGYIQIIIRYGTGGTVVTREVPDFVPGAQYAVIYFNHDTGSGYKKKVFLYRVGGGNATVDSLVYSPVTFDSAAFYPVIPLRLDNNPVNNTGSAANQLTEAEYALTKKAYKKAVSAGVSDILEMIEDNENVGDIDYAFLLHGVELNTQETIGKKYLYGFLKNMSDVQINPLADVLEWQQDMYDWEYGTGFYSSSMKPALSYSSVHLKTGSKLPYDVRISWMTIGEVVSGGQGKPGAVKGDLWFEVMPDLSYGVVAASTTESGMPTTDRDTMNHVRLFWQHEAAAFKYLDIYGLTQENLVYGGQSVFTTAREALEETDESAFVLPMHNPSLKKLTLTEANQLAVSNRIIVFNCYKVVKVRWYERGIFRILLVIVLAVVTAFVFPAGAGLLGSHLAVGTSMGLTGITAVMAGAAINALAAIAVTTLIDIVGKGVFGEKFGAIISAVIGFVVMGAFTGFSAGVATFDWSRLFNVDSLMRLTGALAQGVNGWVQGEIAELQDDLGTAYTQYTTSLKEIENRTAELLGYSLAGPDPLMFTGLSGSTLSIYEGPQSFLDRTLLTGSEIADISLDAISSFAEFGLSLPKPYE